MKYAFGVVGSILKTVTGWPVAESGLDSLPVSPAYGWPAGETLP